MEVFRPSLFAFGLLAMVACTPAAESAKPGSSGKGGASGTGGASGSGGAPQGATGGSGGASAPGTGGTTVTGTGGSPGTGGSGGTPDAAPSEVAGGEAGGGDTPAAAVGSSCAGKNYPLCLDFESPVDTTTWTGGSTSAVVTTHPAHGTHSWRLYPMGGPVMKTTKLGVLKDQIYGRFYVHFDPGAPGGHGNIVGAFDPGNNWYEIGWQFDAIMGVYHLAGGNERPLRSMPLIQDQWYCVEFFFDGTKTNMPQWWIDGTEAAYYMAANMQLIPRVVTQFARLEVGFTPYAGLGLKMPDGKGDQTETRVLQEMWIDDIAFDTKRIGCIDGPLASK